MIQFENVSKKYGREYALKDILSNLQKEKYMAYLVQMVAGNQLH